MNSSKASCDYSQVIKLHSSDAIVTVRMPCPRVHISTDIGHWECKLLVFFVDDRGQLVIPKLSVHTRLFSYLVGDSPCMAASGKCMVAGVHQVCKDGCKSDHKPGGSQRSWISFVGACPDRLLFLGFYV